MKIVVNDANVLIDLVDLNILPFFFLLKFEFHTTDLIFAELFSSQQEALVPYIESGYLIIETISESDLFAIININKFKPNLSEQDCSALGLPENECQKRINLWKILNI